MSFRVDREELYHTWRRDIEEIHRRWQRRRIMLYGTKVVSALTALVALGWLALSVFGK